MDERDRFKADPEIRQRVEECVKRMLDTGRGLTVEWPTLEAIAGGSREDNRPKYIIDRARRELRDDYGIATRAVNCIGVRMLTPEEQITECPIDRRKRASRQIRRGTKELSGVDAAALGMSTHYVMMQHQQEQALKQEESQLQKSNRTLRTLQQGTQTHPRRNPE